MANPRPKQLVEESLELFDKLQSSDDSPSKTFAAEGLIVAGGKIFRDKIKGVFVTAQLKDLIKNKKQSTRYIYAAPLFVSIITGILFAVIRLIDGIRLHRNGKKSQAYQEYAKLVLELVSGVLGVIGGVSSPVGISLGLVVDAGLAAWDIANVLLSTSSSSTKTTVATLLKTKLLDLDVAITKEDYTLTNFLMEVFAITFKKIGTQEEEQKAASDASYIYGMVERIFDEFFTDKFSTGAISDEMRKVGFSEPQIRSFNALARSNNRS